VLKFRLKFWSHIFLVIFKEVKVAFTAVALSVMCKVFVAFSYVWR